MAEDEYESPVEALAWEVASTLGRISAAEAMQTCPQYARGGKCSSGCWDEPHCITDEPVGGWDEDQRAARSYLEALLGPSVAPGALLDREAN